jgi:hypothetical protein
MRDMVGTRALVACFPFGVAAVVIFSSVAGACGSDQNADAPPFSGGAGSDAGLPADGGEGASDLDAAARGGDAEASDGDAALPYPTRSAYRIKALQPDFWPMDEVAGNNTGGVAMNLVWATWEPSRKAAPCTAANETAYDGHCFASDAAVEQAIKDWTLRGVVVTAVLYGVPAWARTTRVCSPVSPGFEIFCAPDDAADYGRFAGMLAQRFDGKHGHGRIADFVIHNEVNSNDWFDVGCGQGVACDPTTWIDTYSQNYASAYDRIVTEQSTAKVLISLEHHFLGPGLDAPAAQSPLLSGTTFLTRFATKVSPRAWRVAYHPYPPNLLAPQFSPDDAPLVTYGNLGTVAGWLRKTFPSVPSTSDMELTESGVNSLAPSSTPAAQAKGVCDSLRNALGTPGISSYVYHRMRDNPVETAGGLGLGLRDVDGNAKPAWTTWALANRNDLVPPQLSCGFEDVPFTRLTRSASGTRGHWTSSRIAPAGFTSEQSWRLLRDEAPGTVMLYECRAGQHNLITKASSCEGLEPLGPVGYAYAAPKAGAVAIYRCNAGGGSDHFVSQSAACEGAASEGLLGYAVLP